MRLWSDAWANGEPLPERFAAGRLAADGTVGFGDNLSPPLRWTDLPAGTRSLVLMCQDFDVPSRPDDVNQPDREVPVDLPRVDFFHWLLVDLPPTLDGLAEGECSRGFTPRGKPGPALPAAMNLGPHCRHGLNDYTQWLPVPPGLGCAQPAPRGGQGNLGRPGVALLADPELAGRYFGYDGPFPPFNDSLVHHYLFALYALDVPRLAVDGEFTGAQVREALAGHVLDAATLSGTYTLNLRLR